MTGNPQTSVVIFNGVREPPVSRQTPRRNFNRLIFTGNMDFRPNYEAALWFEQQVWPRVLRFRSDACLVIAGANPTAELLSRGSDRVIVTGYVADMDREIASSYIFVAPLISGGGFKNKVLEAFLNRTFVVATTIAVEFLDPALRQFVSIADTPQEMADAIERAWNSPGDVKTCTDALFDAVTSKEFGWEHRAEEVVALARRSLFEGKHSAPLSK